MNARLTADGSGLAAALARLAAAARDPLAAGPLRGATVDAGRAYMGGVRDRFKAASGGDGTWAPLAPSTIYKRLRAAGNAPAAIAHARRDRRLAAAVAAALPVLYVTGDLYSSLAPGGRDYVEEVTATAVRVGSANPLARFHQDGTPRMPARPILTAPTDGVTGRIRSLIASGLRAAVADALAASH